MKYRIEYLSIYREKEELNLTHEIEAKNNEEAKQKAREFIQRKNTTAEELHKCELKGIVKIDQEFVSEVTTPVPL
jgi:hypothetical protein